MDRYVLFISSETPPESEQQLFVSYLNSSLLNEEQQSYYTTLSTEINPLIFWKSAFIAYVTVPGSSKNVCSKWNEVPNVVEQKTIFKISASTNSSLFSISDGDKSHFMSETIHELVDQLPSYGTYCLDVFLSGNLLENEEMSNHIHFLGAIQRLHIWHKAVMYGVLGEKEENNSVRKWCKNFSAHVLTNRSIMCYPLLWRGEIELAPQIYSRQTELRLLPHGIKDWSLIKNALGTWAKCAIQNECDWRLLLSMYMEVIDECDLSSIPFYMFSLPVMQLYFFGENSGNDCSNHLLTYLSSKPATALILRLKYEKLHKSSLGNNMYTTEKWKKAVMLGNIKGREFKIMNPTGHFIFAAVRQPSHESIITMYLLQPNNGTTSLLSNAMTVTNIPVPLGTSLKMNMKEVFGIPDLDSNMLRRYMESVKDIFIKVVSEWISHTKPNSHTYGSTLSPRHVAFIFNKVLEQIFSKLKSNGEIVEKRKFYTLEQSFDSWDWPERIYLLQQQIETDKNLKLETPETISGLSPAFVLNNSAVVSMKDIGMYFKGSGEAQERENVEVIHTQSNLCYLETSLQDMIKVQWPEIMNYKFHDIYYNTNLSEIGELSDKEVKKEYLVHETASLCSNQQILPNSTGISQNSSDFISKRRAKKSNSMSLKSGDYNADIKLSKVTSHYRTRSFKSSVSNAECDKKLQEHIKYKSVMKRVRSCSSDLTQNTIQKSKKLKRACVSSIHDDLSERHKMKLREAVVFALGKYGIAFEHTLFKPCARKLFAVCKPFVKDVIGKGSTTSRLKSIAESHAKQVVDFEVQNSL